MLIGRSGRAQQTTFHLGLPSGKIAPYLCYTPAMGSLDGKAAIVTGSGRGLGRSYAIAMAREGARLVINDVDVDEAEKTVVDIKAGGGEAVLSGDDVTDWAGAKHLVESCVNSFGTINALVNNAGVHHYNPFAEESEADIDLTLAVNIKGTLNTSRHALAHMVPQKQGSIVNVSSGAQSGIPGQTVYGASKAAVAGFTYGLALEVAEHGIRVNAISPLAYTRMAENVVKQGYDLRGLWPPENVAPLAVFLCSDDAWYVTGQIIRLEGTTLSLFSHPKPTSPTILPDGWTVDRIREYFKGTLGRSLMPVGIREGHYRYYGGVGAEPQG